MFITAASIKSLRPSSNPADWRSAKTFSAGESDQVEAHFREAEKILCRRHIGGGIDQRGNIVLFAQRDKFVPFDLSFVAGAIEEEHHRRAVVDGAFQLLPGLDFDELRPGVAHGVVVAVAVGFLDDDFVLHPVGIGDANDLFTILARNASRGCQRQSGGAARTDDRRFALQQLGNALAGGEVKVRRAARTSSMPRESLPLPPGA